jgi:hypothetical protein
VRKFLGSIERKGRNKELEENEEGRRKTNNEKKCINDGKNKENDNQIKTYFKSTDIRYRDKETTTK